MTHLRYRSTKKFVACSTMINEQCIGHKLGHTQVQKIAKKSLQKIARTCNLLL